MGIPGLYRWLLKRYPDTVCSVAEDPFINGGPKIVTSRPNPNGVEFDNLYIDMNGVIHPCFHPERLPAPQSYDDVLDSIFKYIEKVFSIVRPRKLLFLAIDGVAPRAKMNNQRIRRFRAARETAGEVSAVGSGKPEDEKKLDSNVITPGTEFMDLLSSALRYFVECKICADPGWQGIKVILSDSSVVGEGEDKIMSYIRSQRNLPGYDPNTRHCLHGLDADLIMLALATHEINISILREVITYRPNNFTRNQKQKQKQKKQKRLYASYMRQFLHGLEFEFFNIWVLREYLEKELLADVEGTDIDRLIDDFVFICFFVGNDFLPHLPSLDVSKGGIELLLFVYREEFVKMGYLTNAPKVNLKSMEHFLKALSSHESSVFKKHSQLSVEMRMSKRKRGFQDAVMIRKKHMKQDHYTKNFNCESHDVDRIRRDSVLKYTEGVCWIMHYYYQQVCSWQWFYPYHYAPHASDFCGLDKLEINFTLGQPFKPLDQLLGVLPAASAQALPLFYRELMTNTSSPILDFYPKDAEVDMTGKKHVWQGVYKLPFIDESRLLSETAKVEHTLTDEEKRRNRFGRDRLFVHTLHPLAKIVKKSLLCDPTSELQIKINPEFSGGMNGYLCISGKPVCPSNIPSTVVDKQRSRRHIAISVDYKCPSNAHIPKLPRGVIMPPRILRFKDRPRPPVLLHATPTPRVSQSIVSVRKSQKKKRKQDVVLGMALRQDGSKVEESTDNEAADGKQNNIIHGTSEAKLHLVEGNRGLNVTKSTNQVEHDLAIAKQQEITAGNGIIIEETQREKQQVNGNNRTKSGTNESLMNVEKPLTRNCESSLSLGSEPKIKLKKKRVRGDKLEAQVHLVEVSGGAGQNWAGEHEVKGGIMQQQQGTEKINKNTVSVEEVPTREMGSSNNQQEPVAALVRKKNTKRRRVVKGEEEEEEDKKVNGGGSGEKSVDSDEPPTKNKTEHDAITGEQVLLFAGSINGKKPTNKMESQGRIPPFAEGVSQKVNVEIGENLNNKDIVSQEIDKHNKRKEEKKRKWRSHISGGEADISGVDENMNVFEVIEKPKKKLEPATKEKDEKIKRKQQLNQSSNVKTSEKPPIDSLESDILPSSREQENTDAKRKVVKKKNLKGKLGGVIEDGKSNGHNVEEKQGEKPTLEAGRATGGMSDKEQGKV